MEGCVVGIGSEMAGREAFGIGAAVQPQAATMQTMRLPYSSEGTPLYKPVTAPAPQYSPSTAGGDAQPTPGIVGLGGNGSAGDQVKRKRGRPRKYGPDGAMALGLSPALAGPELPSPTDASAKKVRGRPPGSGRKQQMAALGVSTLSSSPSFSFLLVKSVLFVEASQAWVVIDM